MKVKLLKYLCIFLFTGIIIFCGTNEVKVNAETNGWINTNNSWRYYSGPSIITGWYEYDDDWYFLDENGMPKTGWIKSEGKWYYLDERSGKMLTGWIQDKGKWYYLNRTGEMKIGWFKENGNLYYLNDAGVMVKNCYVDSYYFGPTGAWEREPWYYRDYKRK